MMRWTVLFLSLLAAAPLHAAGISSFEPDTTTREPRDREPMSETPYWTGSSWSFGSEYLRAADHGSQDRLGTVEYALTATFPQRSRRQTWLEFSYGRWLLTNDYVYTVLFPGESVPRQFLSRSQYEVGIAMLRGGLEHRFGRRTRPWATVGAGVGIGGGNTRLAALDLNARGTLYAYPTGISRIGLQLSGGPMWLSSDPRTFLPGTDHDPSSPVRRHYAAALRFERRMRYPLALGGPGSAAEDSRDTDEPIQTPVWIGVAMRTGNAMQYPDRPLGSELTASRGFAVQGTWPWRSAQQGFVELSFDSRESRSRHHAFVYNGTTFVPAELEVRERLGLLSGKGGVEHRFGDRDRPRFTAGGGVGSVLDVVDHAAYGITTDARATAFLYPSRTTRVGLTLSADLLWDVLWAHYSSLSAFSGDPGSTVHSSLQIALRFERQLRFRPSLLRD